MTAMTPWGGDETKGVGVNSRTTKETGQVRRSAEANNMVTGRPHPLQKDRGWDTQQRTRTLPKERTSTQKPQQQNIFRPRRWGPNNQMTQTKDDIVDVTEMAKGGNRHIITITTKKAP